MALSGQVVYFIGPNLQKHRDQAIHVKDIAVVHMKLQRRHRVPLAGVHFLIQAVHKQMLDAALIESGCVPLDAVDFVTLANEIKNCVIREIALAK